MTSRNRKALALLVGIVLLCGCGLAHLWRDGYFTDAAKARRALAEMGVTSSPEAVFAAVASGDRHALELLERAGEDLLAPEPETGRTPLALAVLKNDPALFPFFLERSDPAALERADREGLTALSHALASGKAHLIDPLLAAGADADVPLEPGLPVLVASLQRGDLEMAARLIEAGADPDRAGAETDRPLGIALESGDLVMLDLLLELGADPALPDASGRGLIHRAALRDEDYAETLPRLVAAGAGIDSDYLGNTPLRLAVLGGRTELVRLLIELGAERAKAEWDGSPTLLGQSAAAGREPICRMLLDEGAVPDEGGTGESTPLRRAWEAGHLDCAKAVLDHGADPAPLLEPALADRDWAMTDLLLAAGQDIDTELSSGLTALVTACEEGDAETARQLLLRGAAPESLSPLGDRLLPVAVARGQVGLVQDLLAHGADPTIFVKTPASLPFRQLFGEDEVFRHYLQIDEDITPVMMASVRDDIEILRALLAAGAPRWVKTRRYRSHALYLAGKRRLAEVQQIILDRDPHAVQPRKIIVDLSSQRATFYREDKAIRSTDVSTGRKEFRTPTGSFVITSKHRHHRSNLYDDARMPYFLRLSCDAIGLHEGYLPGYPASHGCIRVPAKTARVLFRELRGRRSRGDPSVRSRIPPFDRARLPQPAPYRVPRPKSSPKSLSAPPAPVG